MRLDNPRERQLVLAALTYLGRHLYEANAEMAANTAGRGDKHQVALAGETFPDPKKDEVELLRRTAADADARPEEPPSAARIVQTLRDQDDFDLSGTVDGLLHSMGRCLDKVFSADLPVAYFRVAGDDRWWAASLEGCVYEANPELVAEAIGEEGTEGPHVCDDCGVNGKDFLAAGVCPVCGSKRVAAGPDPGPSGTHRTFVVTFHGEEDREEDETAERDDVWVNAPTIDAASDWAHATYPKTLCAVAPSPRGRVGTADGVDAIVDAAGKVLWTAPGTEGGEGDE